MPTGGVDIGVGGFLADAVGATAGGLIADAGVGALAGGALGGLESGLSGGNILKGVERGGIGGALTGGGIGLGGDLLGSTLGTTVGDALGGAAGGALGGVATHSSPLTGALEGGAAGTLAGLTASPSAGGGPSGSAASSAAPSSVGAVGGSGGDVTLSSDLSKSLTSNVGSGTVGTPSLSGGENGFISSLSSPVADNIVSTGGAAGATSTAAGPTSLQNFVSNPSFSNAGKILEANPGAALSGVGLGIDALKSGATLPGEKQLKSEAGQLAGQGNQLQQYLQNGTLPPGLQTGLTQATDAAKATIRSQYAAKGMSGSSAEQQDLANADKAAQAQGAQLGLQLLNTGISESGMASQLYESILKDALEKDKDLGTAISSFASAAGGGGQAGTFKLTQA